MMSGWSVKAEVIIGAEIDHLAASAAGGDLDPAALRSGDEPLALIEAVGLDLRQLPLEMVEEALRHAILQIRYFGYFQYTGI
jgi:hypothetical protein